MSRYPWVMVIGLLWAGLGRGGFLRCRCADGPRRGRRSGERGDGSE